MNMIPAFEPARAEQGSLDVGRPTATAVIQARMSSTRFSGKILEPVAGKPLLWHIVHRLSASRYIDRIVIATSTDRSDDPVEAFAAREGARCVRGSLDNVLERFCTALSSHPNPYVVRVCGDSPLIDAEMIDGHIDFLAKGGGDYAIIENVEECIHEGFEVFTSALLDRVQSELADDPIVREHVTGFMKQHPDFCDIRFLPFPEKDRVPGRVRLSIDTPADLRFVETLYELSGASAGELNLTQAARILRGQPELRDINTHVRQKHVTDRTRRVLIYRDSGRSSDVLATIFRDRLSWGVCIASSDDAILDEAASNYFWTLSVAKDRPPLETLTRHLTETSYDAVVIDVNSDISKETVVRLSSLAPIVAVCADKGDTINIYGPSASNARPSAFGSKELDEITSAVNAVQSIREQMSDAA